MKYILLGFCFFSLFSCDRPHNQIGTSKLYYEWVCLKKQTKPGMGFIGGKSVMTVNTSCIIAKCFSMKKTYGQTIFDLNIEKLEMVDESKCLEKKRIK